MRINPKAGSVIYVDPQKILYVQQNETIFGQFGYTVVLALDASFDISQAEFDRIKRRLPGYEDEPESAKDPGAEDDSWDRN